MKLVCLRIHLIYVLEGYSLSLSPSIPWSVVLIPCVQQAMHGVHKATWRSSNAKR